MTIVHAAVQDNTFYRHKEHTFVQATEKGHDVQWNKGEQEMTDCLCQTALLYIHNELWNSNGSNMFIDACLADKTKKQQNKKQNQNNCKKIKQLKEQESLACVSSI